jgi:hypothetical protein
MHNFNQAWAIGPLMDHLSLVQPLSADEWEEYYLKNVKTQDHLDRLAERVHGKIQDAIACLQDATLEDCRQFFNQVIFQSTLEGYNAKRDCLLQILREGTRLEFDYLQDHPQDWRPKDFMLDYAVLLSSGRWLGIKVIPESANGLRNTMEGARLFETMAARHQEFQDRDLGEGMLTQYHTVDGVLEFVDQRETLRGIIAKAEEMGHEFH